MKMIAKRMVVSLVIVKLAIMSLALGPVYAESSSEIDMKSEEELAKAAQNLPNGWYLTSSPVITANWEADSSDVWTVPLGGGAGKIFRIGEQAMNA